MLDKIISMFMSIILFLFGWMFPVPKEDDIPLEEQMLNTMTLNEKICQMLMPDFRNWTIDGKLTGVTELNDEIRDAIKKYNFGGIILFAENCQGTEQTTRLINDFQSQAKTPMLVSVDQEGGYIVRLQTGTGTVGNMALGAINDYDVTFNDAARIGSELKALGFNTDFAPDLDVNCNPANPIIGIRSFSSNAKIVAENGAAYIKGMHSQDIATSAKHFPGHGDTATDSHTGLPLINKSYNELKETELVPFKAGIAAGTDLIMTAHIVFPQIEKNTYISKSTGEEINLPATLSKTIITDILRKDLGYTGVVVTDAMNMAAISDNFSQTDSAVLAINAGVDMLLMPVIVRSQKDIYKYDEYIANIANAVKNGVISEERINEAVLRILKLKKDRGILEKDELDIDAKVSYAKTVVGSYEHHQAEFATAEKAITILKNDGALPLTVDASSKPIFLYPYDGEESSIKMGVDRAVELGAVAKGTKLDSYLYKGESAENYREKIEKASGVVIFTESYSANYFNPSHTSGWQAVFTLDMIKLAHSLGKKITVVSIHLPYDIAKYTLADALVLAYGAKDVKQYPEKWDGEVKTFGINIPASVSVILGGAKPCGKCPVDIPKISAESKYLDEIEFPVGYGLNFASTR